MELLTLYVDDYNVDVDAYTNFHHGHNERLVLFTNRSNFTQERWVGHGRDGYTASDRMGCLRIW